MTQEQSRLLLGLDFGQIWGLLRSIFAKKNFFFLSLTIEFVFTRVSYITYVPLQISCRVPLRIIYFLTSDVNEFLNLLIRIKLFIIKESRKRGNELSFQNDASFVASKKVPLFIFLIECTDFRCFQSNSSHYDSFRFT